MLLISAIILAFAKPYMPTKNIASKAESFSIYIDNSLSMGILNKTTNTSSIEEAKQVALEIVKSLDKDQKINIITNDYSYNNQKFQNKEKAIEIIDKIELSPFNTTICDIINRQNNLYENTKSLYKFIISDFEYNFIEKSNCNIKNDNNLQTIYITTSNKNNISIKSCEFEHSFHKKGQKEQLIVELENHGKENADSIQFKLYINDGQRGIFSINIPAESSSKKYIDIINTEDGPIAGKIEIINDDEFQFDNTLFFSYEIKEKIRILCISEETATKEIVAVFNDPIFDFKQFSTNQLKISEIKNYDLIILDHLEEIPSGLVFDLNKSLEKTNNILILTSEDLNIESYNIFLSALNIDNILQWNEKEINTKFINQSHWIFNSVFQEINDKIDLPQISGYFKIENKNLNTKRNDILKLLNNDMFFGEYERNGGSIFLCTSPIKSNYNNFSNHAIFLPIMHNICRNNNSEKMYYFIEKNLEIELPNTFSELDVPVIKYFESEIEKKSFFPDLKVEKNNKYLKLNNNIEASGNYKFFSQNKSEINFKKYLSLNYQRDEIDIKSNTNYKKNLVSLGLELKPFNKKDIIEKEPIDVRFYLIITAIFLFLIELLLLKFWRE
tara:strand:+ start:1466 stop:3307 length:1842 start_codon:yes stop_codon:yes gene_type:complete